MMAVGRLRQLAVRYTSAAPSCIALAIEQWQRYQYGNDVALMPPASQPAEFDLPDNRAPHVVGPGVI